MPLLLPRPSPLISRSLLLLRASRSFLSSLSCHGDGSRPSSRHRRRRYSILPPLSMMIGFDLFLQERIAYESVSDLIGTRAMNFRLGSRVNRSPWFLMIVFCSLGDLVKAELLCISFYGTRSVESIDIGLARLISGRSTYLQRWP